MADEFIIYPLDLTGAEETNLVVDSYNITKMSGELYYQFACRQGPFFKEGAKLEHIQTAQVLRYGIDYVFTYYSETLSQYAAYEQPDDVNTEVFYGVVLQNRRLEGTLKLTAQVVGGDFSTNEAFITSSVNENSAYTSASYDDIVDVPATLPPTSHGVGTSELTEGFGDMVDVLTEINASILALKDSSGTQISDVEGLSEALLGLVDYKGGAKVKLVDKSYLTNENFKSQIKVILPRNAEITTLVSATVKVVSSVGQYEVLVKGLVSRVGTVGQVWSSASARVLGNNDTALNIRATYDADSNPVIYIGDSTTLLGMVHVALTDYSTSSAIADDVVDGWEINFTSDAITLITPLTTTRPNNHTHTTSQLTGNPVIPKTLGINVDLNSLIDNDYRIYTPNFTDASNMLDMNYPLEDASFSLKVVYTDLNCIRQTINYNNGRTFNRIINNRSEIVRDWVEVGLVTEDKYTAASGAELLFLSNSLNTAVSYEVTLVGSRTEGDVYKAILKYVNNNWVAVVLTMGRENATTPVLRTVANKPYIECLDSTKSDTSVVVVLTALN